jgi:peptide-methionine (S)-S-oxide reductase
VLKVISGYSGGSVPDPTYEEVSTGTTGHAECCQVVYDPSKISFDELLEVFWKTHDPTTLNRQGNDVGTQYRSVIFYHSPEQKEKAEHYKAALDSAGAFNKPIVTAIEPYKNFYSAKDIIRNTTSITPAKCIAGWLSHPRLRNLKKCLKVNSKAAQKAKNNI